MYKEAEKYNGKRKKRVEGIRARRAAAAAAWISSGVTTHPCRRT
jgi:hypothetical protein